MFVSGSYSLDEPNFEELLRHATDVINHNCDSNAETIIFIISDPKHYLIREDIRNTYGKNRVKYKYNFNPKNIKNNNISHCFLFSIGYRHNPKVNLKVDFEAYIKKDILRIPVIDQYRKTANKIILTLYLLDKMKISFKFILKSDDDIFLKINDIIPYLNTLKESDLFIGKVLIGNKAIRNKNHKWYVGKSSHSNSYYEPYVNGACYILRRNIIDSVVKRHYTVPLIPMEDIHISYLVTGLGYKLTDSKLFIYCSGNSKCTDSFIVDIGRNIQKRRSFIKEFKDSIEYY
ncbi:hypothetical protein HZS_4186 [Henneguya salminicola]|nr:hypothetical protein HZS_4186 [Henneguya salminicola]